MMNVLELQDNLKNFSEDQLVNEMQQPSGNVPQYLVLSEINRRKRIRDDYQQQQQAEQSRMTVAQEKLAGAGVPAEGLAGLAASMAPKTDITENTGATPDQTMPLPEAPAPMAELPRNGGIAAMAGGGYVRRYQLGGPMGVPGRATMVDGFFVELLPDGTAVDQRTGQPVPPEIAQKAQAKLASADTQTAFSRRPGIRAGDDVNITGFGNQSLEELQAIIDDPNSSSGEKEAARTRLGVAKGAESVLQGTGDFIAGVPKVAESVLQSTGDFIAGVPDNPVIRPTLDMFSDAASAIYGAGNLPIELAGRAVSLVNPTVGAGILDISGENKATAEAMATAFDPKEVPRTTADEDNPTSSVPDSGDDLNPSMDKATAIRLMTSDDAYAYTPPSPDPDPTKTTRITGGTGGSAGGGAGSIESQIIEMLKEREKRAESEKWLSLAQAGLALMASDQPTLGGAIGEAGGVGLTRLGEARDDYEGAKMALLKTQQSMQAARASSARSRDYNNPNTIGAALARFENLRDGLLGRGTRVITDPDTGLEKTETVYRTYADLSPDERKLYDSYSGTIANLTRQYSGFFPADMTG